MRNLMLAAAIFIILVSGCIGDSAKIYAIQYGTSRYSSRHIYFEDEFSEKLDFAWIFYVIKTGDRTIVVDPGFSDTRYVEDYGIEYRNPLKLLSEIGIHPSDVTDLVITHSHFDHIDNIDKFPQAMIYIQKDELEAYRKSHKGREKIQKIDANKIIAFDESVDVTDSMHIKKIGGHTRGSSIIVLKSSDRIFYFVGDECYFLDNCINNKPIGSSWSRENNARFIEGVYEKGKTIILPCHDPMLKMGYPQITEDVFRVE